MERGQGTRERDKDKGEGRFGQAWGETINHPGTVKSEATVPGGKRKTRRRRPRQQCLVSLG